MSEVKQKYSVSIERDADYEPQRMTIGAAPVPTPNDPLPCPYCGGTLLGLIHAQAIDGIWTAVVCRRFDCGAQGPWSEHDAYAIERWSKRAAAADVTQLVNEVLAHLEVALFATHPDAAAIVAPYRERLAAIVGDGGGG